MLERKSVIEEVVSLCLSIGKSLAIEACKEFNRFEIILETVLDDVVQALYTKLLRSFEDTVEVEMRTPYSQNHYFMDTVNKTRTEMLRKDLRLKL